MPSADRGMKVLRAACLVYVLGVVADWLLIRFLSDRWWPATVLLYALRWPWLAPLLVLLPIAIRKRSKLSIVLVAVGMFVLWPLMGFNIPVSRPAAPAGPVQKVRLLTCNVHRLELDIPALDAYIQASDPDVVVFQDYSGWDDSPVLRSGWYAYRMGEIFIASRFPITRIRDLRLESIPGADDMDVPHRTGSAACFDVQTPAGLLHVVNLHLYSPHTALEMLASNPAKATWKLKAGSARRRAESARIARFLNDLHGPYVLAGDFNMPAESPLYRQFWSRYPDAFASNDMGYGYTHYTLLSALRIDHVLSGPGVTCAGCTIGPACGTPHRPVVVDLLVQQAHRP